MTTIPLAGGPLKRRIVEMAYSKCSLAGYVLGRTPEEIDDAMGELDAMMLEWPFSRLGYISPQQGISNADESSGIPNETLAAVAQQLALRLAPNMAKSLSPEAQANIQRSMALLHAHPLVTRIPTQPFQRHTPRGLGNRGPLLGGLDPFIEETFAQANPVATGAIVISTVGTTTLGSSNITAVGSTTGIMGGYIVAGAGIPANTTVISITGSTVQISANATASGTNVPLTFTSP